MGIRAPAQKWEARMGGTKMLLGKSSPCIGQRVSTVLIIFVVIFGAAFASLLSTDALAQTPSPEDNAFQSYEDAHASICALYGCGNVSGAQAPHIIAPDPCFVAQNAMRPCTSEPVGVDPNLVGTWDLPIKNGLWVLNILRNGTYNFHSEAHDGTPSHAGTFSANNGHYSLKAKTGFTDAGDYLFQPPNIWIANGQHGAAAWLRPDLAQSALRPCASAKLPMTNSATLDTNLVGTWNLPRKNGLWVWEISRNGTYKFDSEAGDGTPSHTGTFTANNFHWSLMATTGLPGYTDTGLYLFQAPNIWIATGNLGAAAWLHPSCN
jgi:hypothetical protein